METVWSEIVYTFGVPSNGVLWHEQRVMLFKLDTVWSLCTPLTAMREARRQHYFRVPSPTHHIIASININFVPKQKASTLRIAVRARCHIPSCLSQVSASPSQWPDNHVSWAATPREVPGLNLGQKLSPEVFCSI
jgi:hypothetical protein